MNYEDELKKMLDREKAFKLATSIDDRLLSTAKQAFDISAASALGISALNEALIASAFAPYAFSAKQMAAADGIAIQFNKSLMAQTAAAEATLLQIGKAYESSIKFDALFNRHIALPKVEAVAAMLNGFKSQMIPVQAEIIAGGLLSRFGNIEKSMASMQQPWLDTRNIANSFTAFAELQNIGVSLQRLAPFGPEFTKQLRVDFGDWRKPIHYDAQQIFNPEARAEYYYDQGLKPDLSAFPESSFYEGTLRAGLRGHTATVAEGQVVEVIIDQDEEDAPSEERLEDALLYVSKFERHLRRFITQKMVEAFGDAWFMQNVPDEVRRYCIEKQQEAKDRGQRAGELIEYADFTHYLKIITNRKNWKTIFVHYFQSQPRIEESLQRMYPFRNAAMHARAFTNEDELYLLTETSRILKAIGVETSLRGEVKLIIKP